VNIHYFIYFYAPTREFLSLLKGSNISYLKITRKQSKTRVLFMLFKYRKAAVLTLRELHLRYYSCHAHSTMLYLIVCPLSRSYPWLIIAPYVGHISICSYQPFHLRTVRNSVRQTSLLKYENMRRWTMSRHCLNLLSRRKDIGGWTERNK